MRKKRLQHIILFAAKSQSLGISLAEAFATLDKSDVKTFQKKKSNFLRDAINSLLNKQPKLRSQFRGVSFERHQQRWTAVY
jgi:hypothetical protein